MNNALLPTGLSALRRQDIADRIEAVAAGAAPHFEDAPAPSPRLLRLQPGDLLTLDRMKARRLRVQSGRLWITEPGDLTDHFVASGESYTVRGNGRVVVQCDSRVAAAWSF